MHGRPLCNRKRPLYFTPTLFPNTLSPPSPKIFLHRAFVRSGCLPMFRVMHTGQCLPSILCDPVWQVTLRSSVMGFPLRAILGFLTFNRLPRKLFYGELTSDYRSRGGQRKRYNDHVHSTLKQCSIPALWHAAVPFNLALHLPRRCPAAGARRTEA